MPAKPKPAKAARVAAKPSKAKPMIPRSSESTPVTQRIMLDLETFGTAPGAVIITIGAVKFDETGIIDRFECHIDPESSARHGLTMEPSAVLWWLKQGQTARDGIAQPDGLKLPEALEKFAIWVGNPKTEIWGHGSDFDNVLLAAAYRACDIPLPWFYPFNRCYRTVSRMHREAVPFQGNSNLHNALADAEDQALHLIKILKHLNPKTQS